MKSPLFLILGLLFAAVLSNARASDDQVGTLTLEADKIVFKTKSGSVAYPLGKASETIPDAQMVNFEVKAISRNGQDIDVSEATLENSSDGTKLVLVESVPLNVVHTLSSAVHTWKPVPPAK